MPYPIQGNSGSRWEAHDASTIKPKGGKGIRVEGTTTFAGAIVASGDIGSAVARVPAIFLGGNTVIVSDPFLDCSQTWNDAGQVFVGASLDITETARDVEGSLYLRIRGGAAGTTKAFGFGTNGSLGNIDFPGTTLVIVDPANIQAGLGLETNGGFAELFWVDKSAASNARGYALGMSAGSRTLRCASVNDAGNTRAVCWVAQEDGLFCLAGANSAAYPALKRSAAQIHARLSDDSAFAYLACRGMTFPATAGGTTGAFLESTVNGRLTLHDWNASGAAFLQMGGTTSANPAWKRSGAEIHCRLADDSADAALQALSVKTGAPAGGTAATWKVGVAAAVSPTAPNRTIEVDIGGTIYYVHAKTTND